VAERLHVNITLARDRRTGVVGEVFAYSGATDEQITGGHNFTAEFRGMMPGPAVGADPTARMIDAETKVKAEIQARLDVLKAKVPAIATFSGPQEAPNG